MEPAPVKGGMVPQAESRLFCCSGPELIPHSTVCTQVQSETRPLRPVPNWL